MAKKKQPAKKRGRPSVAHEKRTVRASVALPRAELEELRTVADERGVSVSSIVAELVRRWLRRQRRS